MGALSLKIGQPLGFKPEGEGPAPVLTGQGFEIFCFQGGLTLAEVAGFAGGPVSCGLYVDQAIPVLALDIEGYGAMEVAFCIFAEPEDTRAAYLDSDPLAHTAHLVLCDYPSSLVRAVRAINPAISLMARLRQGLMEQLGRYQGLDHCFKVIDSIYERLGPGDIRAMISMRLA